MFATALAIVSIAACTSISGTLTWNKGDIVVPSPIIVKDGDLVRNPITLQDKTKLQCYVETEKGLIPVGWVTYGKVSIVGQKVSVPYVVNYLPLPDFSRYPGGGAYNFNAPETHRGFFAIGLYDPNNDFLTGNWNSVMGRNQVSVTSNTPITGVDLNYWKDCDCQFYP
jgi:hypothetical protein